MKRFDVVEAGGIFVGGVISGLLLWQLMPSPREATSSVTNSALVGRAITDELSPLVSKLGRPHFSSHEEELFVRDFFKDRRDGVFVDVGAGHYRDRSNTFFLEQHLGWSGLAIDAQAKFADDYHRYRQRTRFFSLFVSDRSNEHTRLFIGQNDLFSSSSREFTAGWVPVTGEQAVPTITLNDLLESTGITRVDFVTMDIELAEPQALAGFDVGRYRPELFVVEAHPQVRQSIVDYFHRNGYVIVGKYLRADPQNLWFMPSK